MFPDDATLQRERREGVVNALRRAFDDKPDRERCPKVFEDLLKELNRR